MSLRIANVVFDCSDALTVARFWSAALARPVDEGAESGFASIGRWELGRVQPALFFAQVPEAKEGKNRVHVDISNGDRAGEVERLTGLGATVLADVEEWGHRWTVMADPEGNEFCVS